MELVRLDTQKAYLEIRDKIIKLQLSPGSLIDEAALARELRLEVTPVREALQLLIHDDLIDTSRRGLFVSQISYQDLKQLGELRLMLEPFSARKAAECATPDDIAVLEALGAEHKLIDPSEPGRLLEVDHKFHQAIAAAAGNHYLERALDLLFSHSQRFWYLVLPDLTGLAGAVETHLELLEAIKQGDGESAAKIMRYHVEAFLAESLALMPAGSSSSDPK